MSFLVISFIHGKLDSVFVLTCFLELMMFPYVPTTKKAWRLVMLGHLATYPGRLQKTVWQSKPFWQSWSIPPFWQSSIPKK